MMKKIMLIITLLIILIVCTSCIDSRELNELGIITATALDIENEKIILTVEIVIPPATEQGSPIEDKVRYIQSTGDTIFDAYRNVTLEFDRKLYLPHNKALIFGEEFAKRGIGDYIDFYLTDAEPRETAYMLIAKGNKAYELIGINEGICCTSGDYLKDLVENSKYTGRSRKLTLYEYFKHFFEYRTPVLGVVQKVEKREISKKESQDTPSKPVLNVSGGAVFKGDKLEGYYTGDEMIGYNFMIDKIEDGLIIFETPNKFSDDNKLFATKGKFTTIEIISSRTKKDIELVNEQLHLNINVRLKGVLGEETKGLGVAELPVKDAIEKGCSDKVEEYIRIVMEKAQNEFEIDNFAIRKLVYIKYPEVWKEVSDDWDKDIFPNISYSINVETNMVKTGLINTPVNIERGRK